MQLSLPVTRAETSNTCLSQAWCEHLTASGVCSLPAVTCACILLQASELKAKMEVLKSASLEAAEHAESQQAEQSSLQAELASRSAELDQARQGAAQAAQHAQHSSAQAAEELAQTQRGLDECQEELLRSRAATQRAERELEMCQAGLKQSMEAQHSVREELALSREALEQCQKDLLQSKEAAQRAADAARGLEQDRDRLEAVAGKSNQAAADLHYIACQSTSLFNNLRSAPSALSSLSMDNPTSCACWLG